MMAKLIWGGTVGAAHLPVVTGLVSSASRRYAKANWKTKAKVRPETRRGPLSATRDRPTPRREFGVIGHPVRQHHEVGWRVPDVLRTPALIGEHAQ